MANIKSELKVMGNYKDITEGSVKTGLVENTRNCGRPKISWLDNITIGSDLSGYNILCAVQNSKQWGSFTHSNRQLPHSIKDV